MDTTQFLAPGCQAFDQIATDREASLAKGGAAGTLAAAQQLGRKC